MPRNLALLGLLAFGGFVIYKLRPTWRRGRR
jgi:hypothetical protein